MSKIDSMPPMCHDCPRWELCEFPYVCPDTDTEQTEVIKVDEKTIDYSDCSNALLKLWMENIITDGQYNLIMDRLNKAHKDGVI